MRRPSWGALVAACLFGVAAGLGAFTFHYGRGASYLGSDPAACANCHAMSTHYAAWIKGSHRAVAVCNDCHAPHDLVGKYLTKARNGFWHSVRFTSGQYPDVIRINQSNRAVTEGACRSCHGDITSAMDPLTPAAGHDTRTPCLRCHADVGHWVR